MKMSNKNKFISGLVGVAMCPMMLPTAAFAADDGAASGVSSSPTELIQSSDQSEGADTGARSADTLASQSESTGEAANTTAKPVNEEAAPAAETGGESTTAAVAVAEVKGVSYPSLQAAIDAAPRNATVKLLADTKENVVISANAITLDLNGYTLNGSTGERKPALTINAVRVTVQDSSEAQTGTIMREDTAENSGVSSHYVIDLQGKNGFLLFNSGTVKNNSGAGGTKGASLVRIGSDSNKKAHPVMTIAGGTFTQDNFVAIKVDFGTLHVKAGVIISKNSYAIENWLNANIKEIAVVNGNVSTWTYDGGSNSNLNISGGTVMSSR